MSQPPPYGRSYSPGYGAPGSAPLNPDTRELPPGWIQQWDENYKAWFYVNTREQPPRSSWVHPLGPPPSSPRPGGYGAPAGPPPPDRGYDSSPYAPSPSGGYDQRYGAPPQPAQRYAPAYGDSPSYTPPQGGYRQDESRGWFGGSSAPPPPQPQVEVVQAPPQKKHHFGAGTALAAGGAGILGGMLIGDLIEHHDERERMEGFDAGMMDRPGFGGGFGGPDFGPGGFDDGPFDSGFF